MLLPTTDMKWPPPPFDQVHRKYKELAAWYSGDRAQLLAFYGRQLPVTTTDETEFPYRPAQFSGGIVGAVARAFWGTPKSKGATYQNKLHIPIASEIASEGGYQLFHKPPRIEINSAVHQQRIDEYIENDLFIKLLRSAEIGSALGDAYIRVGYDAELSTLPLLSIMQPDGALPTFVHDIMKDVIFWRVLSSDSGQVIRHLERHGNDGGVGRIEHALYIGTNSTLGKRVPLASNPFTNGLADIVRTFLPELDSVFIPNLSTRIWRDLGHASNLGRSDYDAAIGSMDSLDEAWTSWLRDIWLGKARLIVPQGYLESPGRGQQAVFDLERSVFVEMNAIGVQSDKLQITPSQFAIRHESHLATTMALTERVVSGSGYSAQTFGLNPTVAMTATESISRENKTEKTRGAKIEIYKRAIIRLVRIMLQTDARWGNAPLLPSNARIIVEFPPANAVPLLERANAVKAMKDAEAASEFIRIRTLWPEWTNIQVEEEVKRILKERQQLVA